VKVSIFNCWYTRNKSKNPSAINIFRDWQIAKQLAVVGSAGKIFEKYYPFAI
jgi:hypothetical protein